MRREAKKVEKKGRKIIPLLFFIALIVSMTLGLQSRKKIKKQNAIELNPIQITQEAEEKTEIPEKIEKAVITRPRVTMGDKLAFILKNMEWGVEYSLIEIDGQEVNLTGEALEIGDIYKIEGVLRGEGATKINSDYIRRNVEGIQFKIDLSLEDYIGGKLEPYVPERRRIFATPTEQRAFLDKFISRRCEIVSIGRSQKRDFTPQIIETGIPYHVRGDLYDIANLLLEIEDGRVFMSLLDNPIKLIIKNGTAELYFKVTGYSGSFS